MHALIVDDSEPMRKLLGMMLQKLGFESVEAASALEAQGHLARSSIAVALVDWGLPGVNGIEFIKNIRGQARYQDLKIIMTTALSEHEHKDHAYAAGANEYLMKPLTANALRTKLESLGLLRGSAATA